MKTAVLIFILCLIFPSCDFFKDEDADPPYKAKIAWDSKLYSGSYQQHMVDGDSVFFYEAPPGDTLNIYMLTRLDAETGALIWRSSVIFHNILRCPPVVIGGYVYVFLKPNIIWCFNRETGERTACVRVPVDNKDFDFEYLATAYQDYLYLGYWTYGRYFIRIDVNLIDRNNDTAVQAITPEILWLPENEGYVSSKPVVYENTVYAATRTFATGIYSGPVELAGFDVDSGLMTFHTTFGGPEDVADNIPLPEEGDGFNPILIHEGVLYYLHYSINAWDLKTGERLYRHVFTNDIPLSKRYRAITLQAVFYKGNIYYTSGSGSGFDDSELRNIHCIDAATGKLVWNASPKRSETLDTNPIIAHDKLYVCEYDGLYVFKPENGKLLGIDKSFRGAGQGRNILYKDYMICIQRENDYDGKLVAVYVGE